MSENLRELDLKYCLHPSTNLRRHHEAGPFLLADGQGAVLRDVDGRKYLDFRSGNFNCNLGYGDDEIAEAAVAQMRSLQYAASAGGWSSEPLAALSRKLASLLPEDLNRVLVMTSGSEVLEAAIKLARYLNRLEGKPRKHRIISRRMSYHGSSGGVLPITDVPEMRDAAAPLAPGFELIERPYCHRCPFGKTYPSCKVECAEGLERAILRLGPDSVAAFVGEPVMVMGGVLAPPAEYWPTIRDICSRHNVLLIADEVAQGLGRTGRLFGMDHWATTPDMVALSKGLGNGFFPVSALVVRDSLYDRLRRAGDNVGLWHFHTFTGHPVGSAVGLKSIEVIERRGLVAHAAAMGDRLLAGLDGLRGHPLVGDVRGLGLFAAVELVVDRGTNEPAPADMVSEYVRLAAESGLLVRSWPFANYVVLAPPLIVTEQQIDQGVEILRDCLERLAGSAATGHVAGPLGWSTRSSVRRIGAHFRASKGL